MIYTFKLISHPSRPMVVTFGAKVKTQPSFPFKNAFILLRCLHLVAARVTKYLLAGARFSTCFLKKYYQRLFTQTT